MGGRKLKLIPFLFKTHSSDSPQIQSSWPWPSCSSQPKTLSFRAAAAAGPADIARTAFFFAETEHSADEEEEAVLRGLQARDRLFFEPGETSSILDPHPPVKEIEPAEEPADDALVKGSLVTPMDSIEPLMDFRKSMEEMVEAYGLTDWTKLEELLGLYLTVNEKSNHGYIIGAFADLLIGICFAPPSPAMTPSLINGSEEEEEEDHDHHHGDMGSSMSTSMSRSPTSALSFSSSSSSSSIVQSSLALLEPDDDEIQITASSGSASVI